MRRSLGRLLLALLFCGTLTASSPARSQEAAQKKSSVPPYALIFGNVFDPAGRLFAGAEVQVRRENETKPRWRAQSDARGEFAVRLPAAAARYVVRVRAKGFAEEVQTVTVSNDERVDLSFRLQPASGGKR